MSQPKESPVRGIFIRSSMILLFCVASQANAQQPTYPFRDTSLPAEKRIANLLSLMTLEEKIAVLGTDTSIPRLNIESIGSSEGIHGVVQRANNKHTAIPTTQFPQPVGMGETWDPELVKQAGAVEGLEGRFISQTAEYNRRLLVLWGPQADLARDPRWGRSEEVYGEDPYLNGTMVVSFIKGLQGDDPAHWQTAALLKHFLANSNENFRNSSSSDFDQRLFWEYYSVPFRMGFTEGGARAVMASYNAWNGTPMAVNPILKSLVEDKWGVDILSSDGGAVKLLVTGHKRYPDQKAAVIACLHAGINQFLDTYKDEALAAVREGSVSEAELDSLVARKFQVALLLGVLDPPGSGPFAAVKDQPAPWTSAKDKSVSEKMALESVVLLKNTGNLLPLKKETIKSVAVLGPLADSVHWDWYGGNPPHAVTPLEGIKNRVGPGVQVRYTPDESGAAAIDAARSSDVAIVVVGNDPTCGPDMAHEWGDFPGGGGTLPCSAASDGREGRDRETLTLAQEQLVKRVYAVNRKTIVILVSSFPFTINWSQENVPAILHMAHASQDEGAALAKVLFGDYNPAGRLVTTWPKSIDQLPPMMDYDIRKGRTYMYFKGQPLYPFGFGLSYTTFKYSNLRTETRIVPKDGTMNVKVDISNTGALAGEEVVQLYVKHLGSKVSRPQQELKAFQRVPLAAGETKTVSLSLPVSRLAYWNEKLQRLEVEAEPLQLRVGASSRDIRMTKEIEVR